MIPASIQNHIFLMGQLLSTSVNALISSGKEFQERHHPGFHEDVDRKTSSKACCTQPWRSTRVCCLCALSSACHRIFFSGYNAHRYLSRKLTWKLNMRILHRNLLFCQKKPLVFGVCHIRWKCFFFSGCAKESRIKVAAGGTQVGARKTRWKSGEKGGLVWSV